MQKPMEDRKIVFIREFILHFPIAFEITRLGRFKLLELQLTRGKLKSCKLNVRFVIVEMIIIIYANLLTEASCSMLIYSLDSRLNQHSLCLAPLPL